ncbi:unnamed protein product [Gongylonema pulchrum]|uniref:Uncharacterized protein n=1 Tax=Gongylonema pulchrum TaxID=637853 RepID=A0A183DI11_9BILA|nr:unnamed protein product [Gongylonema pulchrum]
MLGDKEFWRYPVKSLIPSPSSDKVKFSSEHSSHSLNDGFRVTSTVTYTDRLYKKMPRNLRFSERMSHYEKANFLKTFNNEDEYSTIIPHLENMKPPLSRASSVFVVYTDRNLLASQTEVTATTASPKSEDQHNEGETTSNGGRQTPQPHSSEGTLVARFSANGGASESPSQSIQHMEKVRVNQMPDSTNTGSALNDTVGAAPTFSGSRSLQSVFTETQSDNKKRRGDHKSIRRSATWALRGGKSRKTHQVTNIFEQCERESISGDGSKLHHADCLMRVNFFAERMTEHIAELAAIDLANRFKAELNPRAIYFSQMCNDVDVQSEWTAATSSESGDEEAVERKIIPR